MEEKGNTHPNYSSILSQIGIVFNLQPLARHWRWKGKKVQKEKKMWAWNVYCTRARKEIFLWKMGQISKGKISALHLSELWMQETNTDLLLLWYWALDVPILFCKTCCGCCYIRGFLVTKFGIFLVVQFDGCWVKDNSNISRIRLQQYYT